MSWVRAFPAADLTETGARGFVHEGRGICVALADGRPCAVDDRCPHRGAALSGGLVRNGVITCPGHFRRFDLRTGECLSAQSEPVRGYECAVVDGWVQVKVEPAAEPRSLRAVLLAPARAERSHDVP